MNTTSPTDTTKTAPNPATARAQKQLGPYFLDELIQEQDGYAVFSAMHIKRKHRVTLCLLPPLRDDADNFNRDLAVAQRIQHPSVASVVDTGEIDGIQYVAYEHIDGISVQSIVNAAGSISPPVACAIVRQAAIGLHHIHEHGLLHCGMSPSNLFVNRSGVVKILGLGVAAHASDHPTQPGASENANYLAPEQLAEHAEPRSDIYGLGCTLYFMLIAQAPPSCVTRPKTGEKLSIAKPSRELSPALVSVVEAMLAMDPMKRVQLLTQVVGAMCNWASEENLPSLVAQYLPPVDANQGYAPYEDADQVEETAQQVSAQVDPKSLEFTAPAKPKKKIGPAVGVLALVLAASYGGFLHFGRHQPSFGWPEQTSATRAVADSAMPLEARLALPQRIAAPSKADAETIETERVAAVAATTTPEAVTTNSATDETPVVPTEESTAVAEPVATELVANEPSVVAEPIADAQTPTEELSEPVPAETEAKETTTISAALEARSLTDKSVDQYHNRLRQQLQEEYGLTGGQWVLTPNEFALISSVVSYGQKITQDETTDKEDFGRLVRMKVAGKGAEPWAAGLYIPEIDNIEKGDRVLVVVWLRTAPEFQESEGKVGIFVESASDHRKEVYLAVKPTGEWRQFLIPFQAKVARDLRVGFHLAFKKQEIDYGGLTLINFGKTAPFWNAIPAGPRRHTPSQ